MGKGLSELQKTILRIALQNKEAGNTLHFCRAQALHRVYGFPVRILSFGKPASLTCGGGKRFDVASIGHRYHAAAVAVTKALDRLVARNLLVGMFHFWCDRRVGANLTEAGENVAKGYRLTNGEVPRLLADMQAAGDQSDGGPGP